MEIHFTRVSLQRVNSFKQQHNKIFIRLPFSTPIFFVYKEKVVFVKFFNFVEFSTNDCEKVKYKML